MLVIVVGLYGSFCGLFNDEFVLFGYAFVFVGGLDWFKFVGYVNVGSLLIFPDTIYYTADTH